MNNVFAYDLFTSSSVEVLRAENQRNRETPEGAKCPVCDQFCKIYKRRIYGQMVAGLVRLYRLTQQRQNSDDKYFHVKDLLGYNGGDFAKLRYWDLIRECPNRDGFWAITKSGEAFLKGEIGLPKHVRLYNDSFYGFVDPDDKVFVRDILGEKFNYDELMNL